MLFKHLKLKSWRPFLTLSPSISITSSYSYSSISSTFHLKIGDVLKKSQKFSHQDVLQFSNLTHDSNPLHFDSQSARDAGFRDCIVHGMLVAALFPRTIASYFPGAVYISQGLQFKLPVYIEDEVVAEVQARSLREHKKRYIAKFSTKCFKNGELLVIDGEAMAILPTLTMNEEQCTHQQQISHPRS
ncbi:MaoC-like domain-containing protein [Cinnamomum micranthum f. kanehirae]|uniref:MaoC-like domain-containing protein n=1 Tax=Cinnamomum micranthum f. kanehirae TaxID=337451 RepID=A0A443Q2H4_9MAGN|nr:MaoC-like domain-containing protein [Cinnamomum micranthum f. kanehirae]